MHLPNGASCVRLILGHLALREPPRSAVLEASHEKALVHVGVQQDCSHHRDSLFIGTEAGIYAVPVLVQLRQPRTMLEYDACEGSE